MKISDLKPEFRSMATTLFLITALSVHAELPYEEIDFASMTSVELYGYPPYLPSEELLRLLVKDYFGDPKDEKYKKPWTLEELKDKKEFDALFEIGNQIGLLRNIGFPVHELDWLEEYGWLGIEFKENGSKHIDLNANPRWIRIGRFFWLLDSEDNFEEFRPLMREVLHIDEDNLRAMRKYIRNNNRFEGLQRKQNAILKQLLPGLREARERSEELAHEIMIKHYYVKGRLAAEFDREWALGLLQSVDEATQRILVEKWNHISVRKVEVTSRPMDREQDIKNFYQLLDSGKVDELVKNITE